MHERLLPLHPQPRGQRLGAVVFFGALAALGCVTVSWSVSHSYAQAIASAVVGLLIAIVFVRVLTAQHRALLPGLILTSEGFVLSGFDVAWSNVETFKLHDGEAGTTHVEVVLKRRVRTAARTRRTVLVPIQAFDCDGEPLLDVLTEWWTRHR